MKQHAEMSLFVKHVADKQQFPVSFLTLHSARHSQSRSRHFGGIPEGKKTRPDHVTRNELAARVMRPTDNSSHRRQAFCTVLSVSLKILDAGILLLAVLIVELENGSSV